MTANSVGVGATSGVVSVSDTLPNGLTATGINGTGWTCTLASFSCKRSDALAASASYPSITLTCNVAAHAPPSFPTRRSSDLGGELNTTNDTASDVTAIGQVSDLTIAKSHTGN